MGSDAHLVAIGGPELALDRALARLVLLERRWSRFRPDSELSRLNRAGGAAGLSLETFGVVQGAVDAWAETGGLFDPTIHDALVAAGYDRTFEEVAARRTEQVGPVRQAPVGPTPGCGAVVLDGQRRQVRLPERTVLDLGGIGKGWAADLLVDQLRGEGCTGVCVNLGGDLRVSGPGPADGAWLVEVAEPVAFDRPAPTRGTSTLGLLGGAVATSSQLRRAWASDSGRAHHLIDPRTGRPAATDLATVTVIADLASRAEVLAKVVLIAGDAPGSALLADEPDVAALLVGVDGQRHAVGGFDRYLRPAA